MIKNISNILLIISKMPYDLRWMLFICGAIYFLTPVFKANLETPVKLDRIISILEYQGKVYCRKELAEKLNGP